ncbi:MAG TPA: DUF2911 domain-containing protein [Candidatus Acidoferrales bacterium]|jgi:hypothetical protein|nr:DUF2911 domain-containing protein [Candidatus Acidoferrales bacterium]
MLRTHFVVAVLILATTVVCSAQQAAPSSTASCNLDDGRQIYIRFNPIASKNDKLPNGKPWTPGGAPMTLFTEAQLSFGGATIPIGAYTVYPIPSKDKWTLVVNKNVAAGSSYDEKQDIARAPMETDQISQPSNELEVAFAHVGDKCTLRIYFGKSASFAPFTAR